MKKILLSALLVCGAAVADKNQNWKKASIDKQYKIALKSWASQREDAKHLLKYGKVFTDHDAMVEAFNSYVNGGGQKYIDVINAVKAKKKRKYNFQPFYETVYPSCLNASTSMVWMNFWSYANNQNDFNKKQYADSYAQYVKDYNNCKKEVDAPKPKRSDFKPRKYDEPGKCKVV
ncbi:MAG: hypothetical protein KGV50_00350 [Gammaproteobacteria bacterium]|nr:hypothetical protein [Gammaproteobacteria bacterium]